MVELAIPDKRHHIGAMTQRKLTQAIQAALRAAPCSMRELAKQAKVPHSTLVRIAKGERLATVEVAKRVGRALHVWGDRCLKQVQRVERAVQDFNEEV